MGRGLDFHKPRSRGNQLQRFSHLLDRAEWIAGAMHKQGRCAKGGEMLDAERGRLAGRM